MAWRSAKYACMLEVFGGDSSADLDSGEDISLMGAAGLGSGDAGRLTVCEGTVSLAVEGRRGLVVAFLSPRRPLGVRALAS